MASSEELHFKDGFWGRAAKFFQTASNWGDPYEETVLLPSLVSWAALRLSEVGKIGGMTAVCTFFASAILAGAWLGVAWGFTRIMRVVLRGISVGLITASLTALTTPDVIGKQDAIRIGTIFSTVALAGFTAGFYLISPFREMALTTEKQWQVGLERRKRIYAGFRGVLAWLLDVFRMAIGTKDVKGANLAQALVAKLLGRIGRWFIGAALAIFVGGTLFGLSWNDLYGWWMRFRG